MNTPLCKTNLPRKGWVNDGIVDNGDNLQLCPWCGVQEYRYGHIMHHPEVPDMIEVGSTCAEHITERYFDAAGNQRRFIIEQARLKKLKENTEQFSVEFDKPENWYEVDNNPSCWLFGIKIVLTPSRFEDGGWRVEVGGIRDKTFYKTSFAVKAAVRAGLQARGVIE